MPLAAVAVAAFFAAVVLPRATLPMADGDAWWHIHAGEEILATGRVPDANAWTIAGEGYRWTSQDWLSNVGMAVLFDAGPWGVGLLSLAFGLAVVAAFGLLWHAIGRRAPIGWLARLLWLTAGLVVAGPIIGIRVQTLDLLMTAATVWVLWSMRGWRLLLLVPIALLWVNLHAGWVMLFLLGGAQLVGGIADRWLAPRAERTPAAPLLVALLASAAALAANPNGLAIYAYPFETAAIGAHRVFLVEWSPPNLASFEGAASVAFLLGVVAPTLGLGWRTMRTADVLWLIGLATLTIGAVRFALFLGPVGAALAAVHLGPVISASAPGRALSPVLRRWSLPPRNRAGRLANAALVGVVVATGIGLAAVRAAPATQAPAIAASVPIGAAGWLAEHRPRARIFNTYAWGGYLSRRLPEARVYIDGRSDIYGDALIRRYADALNLSTDPSALLDEAGIDVALLRPGAPLATWLASRAEWERAYADDISVVYAR